MGNDSDRFGTGDLRELIYTSGASIRFSHDQLVELLDHARVKNAAHDMTGLLVHADGVFPQVLEGPTGNLQSLLEALRATPDTSR
jgi:hypothetical protein